MLHQASNLNRRGISLTEILIGIMVLGIGVISLATLFPLGLLKMRRAVNDVRGKVLAENAMHELRIRNLLAAPYGPPAAYFSRYPYVKGTTFPDHGWQFPVTPNQGLGLPVIIDPFYVLENARADRYRFGYLDMDDDKRPDNGSPWAEGILRVPGFYLPGADGLPGVKGVDDDANGIIDGADRDGIDGDGDGNLLDPWEFDPGEFGWPGSDDVPGFSFELAGSLFTSPDDLKFGDGPEERMIPYQEPVLPAPTAPPYLKPTHGVPFGPDLAGGNPTLFRERRYTWIIIARKVNARQGLGTGLDGRPGVAGTNDDGINPTDDLFELGWYGSDDTIVDGGGNGVTGPICPQSLPASVATADDPARDATTGLPVAGPPGPFNATIVVFYGRDTSTREISFANNLPAAPSPPAVIFTAGSPLATLFQRSDGVPFPEIPLNSYIMDSTFDSRPAGIGLPGTGSRNGFVYRVVGKTLDSNSSTLTLELDQPARANGRVLTVLKGAVGVFEKEIP